MSESLVHPFRPDASFDGGDLDCGNGLLLLIRRHIDPLDRGRLLEIRSTESSVEEDLPAWCRMTGNELVSVAKEGRCRSFLVCKGAFPGMSEQGMSEAKMPGAALEPSASRPRVQAPVTQPVVDVKIPATLPPPSPAPAVAPLSVMGVGSWPRPRWLLRALHEQLEGRLSREEFEETASDAVRLAVQAQQRAGADVVTDGEQRRDNYASFVGGLLDNCQLIPITDLLPYVDDPAAFGRELAALDVPAGDVRHPAVFGPLGRSRPLALGEFEFVRTLTTAPVKVALPGPYLLTRTMWMECISDRAYVTREELAADIVRVLREETASLLAAGVSIVQFDEPVLSEVVFSGADAAGGGRTFMCGALGARRSVPEELAFAADLLARLLEGMPAERTAVHVCRGNWSPDESVALAGDYRPLLPLLSGLPVGTLFLELCTPRAGELEVLAALPERMRIGVGVCNQKSGATDEVDAVVARIERAVSLFGAQRVLLNPDCGFATFADNPIVTSEVAEARLRGIADAAAIVRRRHGLA